MSNITKTAKQSLFRRFKQLLDEGTKKVYEACKLYVDSIDASPELQAEWREKFPEVPIATWNRFEKIGRDSMDARLLTVAGWGAKKIEKLPVSEQKKVLDNPYVEMVPSKESSPKSDKVKVNIFEMDKEQTDQVFTGDHIRTPAEQLRYLKQLKPVSKPTAKTIKPFDVVKKGKKVVIKINKLCEIDFNELMREVYGG